MQGTAHAFTGQTADSSQAVVDTFTGRVVDKLQAILRGTDEAGADLSMLNDRMFGPAPQAGSTGTGPQPPQARAEQIDVLLDQVAARVAQLGALASGLNARL